MLRRAAAGVPHNSAELDRQILAGCFQTVREIVADANSLLVDLMDTGCIAPPDEDTPTFVASLMVLVDPLRYDDLKRALVVAHEITVRDLVRQEEAQP